MDYTNVLTLYYTIVVLEVNFDWEKSTQVFLYISLQLPMNLQLFQNENLEIYN